MFGKKQKCFRFQNQNRKLLIINIKIICRQKKFLNISGLIFAFSLLGFAFQAKAAESPLDKLINLYKEAAQKVEIKKDKIEYQKEDSSEVKTQEKKDEKKEKNRKAKDVPKTVEDPKEIEKAAEFAAAKTGVRKDFLMGALVVESNLGRNPGQCTYREVESGAEDAHANGRLSLRSWETFKDRRETMKSVADSLGYDYEKLKVSCNPGQAYAGTGGAMGVPQFMPDIWMAYKDRIGEIVGKENPDPWDIQDGVVAMALLLSDTPGVTDHNIYAERSAAKMYLSGTTSFQYEWYADQIIYWSKNYRTLIG